MRDAMPVAEGHEVCLPGSTIGSGLGRKSGRLGCPHLGSSFDETPRFRGEDISQPSVRLQRSVNMRARAELVVSLKQIRNET